MKTKSALLAASIAAVVALTIPSAMGDTYTDTTGDLNDGTVGDNLSGFTHLDITSVEVTNSFTDLILKINVVGNPVTTDWGKYCVGFTTNSSTGDTSTNGNGWNRPISLALGMDYWIGSWVDGGNGIELYAWDGATWGLPLGGAVSKDTNSVTLVVAFADLGLDFGDSIDFEVYASAGGGTDSAVDALSDPDVAIEAWAGPYSADQVRTYTLQTIEATTNLVTLTCDMGVPIWEFDTGTADGFDTNADALYVRGSFNSWSIDAGYKLIQVGATLFSNTVEVVSPIGDDVFYKFYGDPFPEYESPVLLGGGDRSLTVSGPSTVAPTVCFGDRCLTDVPTNTVTLKADMTFQMEFSEFDSSTNGVTLPGSFNGWNTTALFLLPGTAPDTNIYSGTLEYYYYPTGVADVGFYKFKIDNTTTARDGGWERPISTGGGNRSFGLESLDQVLTYNFNDEDGVFDIDEVEKPDADSAQLTFGAYGEAIYEIHAKAAIDGTWSAIGSVTNTSKNFGDVSFTQTGLTGAGQQYYRAVFQGYAKPPLP